MQITRGMGPVSVARNGVATGSIPWGSKHHEAFENYYDRNVHVGICVEDLPEEHNRVTLDESLTDSHGIPAPKVTYTVSENNRYMLDHGLSRAEEVFQAAGATGITRSPAPIRYAGGIYWVQREWVMIRSDPS